MAEAEKKLVARKNEVEKASAEGDKLRGSCQDLVALIGQIKDKQRRMAPVSGDPNVLKDQAQVNQVGELISNLNLVQHKWSLVLELYVHVFMLLNKLEDN